MRRSRRPATVSVFLVALLCGVIFSPSCGSDKDMTAGRVATSESDIVLTAATLAEAMELASRKDALIVVDFWRPICPPCRRFNQAVRENADVQAALAHLVLLKLNTEEPEGAREAARHRVHELPTYQLLNARGEVIDTWIGYHDPEWWIDRLRQALADPVTGDERRARFESTPNVADALALGKAAFTQQRCPEALDYLRQAQRLDPAAAAAGDAAIFLFRSAYLAVGRDELSVPELAVIIDGLLRDPEVKPADVVEVGNKLLAAVPYAGLEPVLPHVRLARSVLPEQCEGEWERQRRRFLVDYALIVEEDAAKALELKRGFQPEGWESDPVQLNSFAWWCFANKVNAVEAERLAKQAVALAADGPEKANYLDTLAELVNLRGDRTEAQRLIEQALALDPGSSHLQDQRQRFVSEEGEG